MKASVYNLTAKKVKDKELNDKVFGLEINKDLVYQVAVSLAANKRRSTAHSKTRGEVRGGGRKPWRQKGTGNARAGSIRSPIFKGGGVTFGPRNETVYKKKINKKMRAKAFLNVLTGKLRDEEMKVIESFEVKKPNTKKFVDLLDKLKVADKSILLATFEKNETLKKSISNIKKVNYRLAKDISSLDLLNHKFLLLDEKSVDYYQEKYSKKSKD